MRRSAPRLAGARRLFVPTRHFLRAFPVPANFAHTGRWSPCLSPACCRWRPSSSNSGFHLAARSALALGKMATMQVPGGRIEGRWPWQAQTFLIEITIQKQTKNQGAVSPLPTHGRHGQGVHETLFSPVSFSSRHLALLTVADYPRPP